MINNKDSNFINLHHQLIAKNTNKINFNQHGFPHNFQELQQKQFLWKKTRKAQKTYRSWGMKEKWGWKIEVDEDDDSQKERGKKKEVLIDK